MMNTQRRWPIVIAVIVAGIFVVMLIGATQRTEGERIGESTSNIVGSAGDGARRFQEEVKDEIDSNRADRW